jgi:hypothetical protein
MQPYHLPKVVAFVVAQRTLAARQAYGLLEIRPQELRKPSKHASRKRKLVRTFSVLSCGTFRHEDSHSPSECVGECTHAWEGIGPLPPSHFAMMSLADIVAIANRHTVIAAS